MAYDSLGSLDLLNHAHTDPCVSLVANIGPQDWVSRIITAGLHATPQRVAAKLLPKQSSITACYM